MSLYLILYIVGYVTSCIGLAFLFRRLNEEDDEEVSQKEFNRQINSILAGSIIFPIVWLVVLVAYIMLHEGENDE